MKKAKLTFKILGVLLFTLVGLKSNAQQDPMFTQYMFNTLAVNPAYAGSRGNLNATGLLRAQWVGIPGAPRTQTFFVHSPLWDQSMGVGLSIVNDRIGPTNQTMIFADYSYTVKINETSKLSFGLKGGMNMLQGNLTDLETTETGDNVFTQNIQSKILPNFGFGIYYHSDRWYVGVSTPKLIQNDIEKAIEYSKGSEKRHYFFIAGYVIDINESIKFKPTVLLKATNAAPLSVDLTAMFLFKEKLWLGTGYRIGDSFNALILIQLNEQFRAGYAYDFTTSPIREYNSGSHEIMLSYDMIYKRDKIMSPRYF